MIFGGIASQDGSLAQLSKVSKEKSPIKRKLTRSENLFRIQLVAIQTLISAKMNYAKDIYKKNCKIINQVISKY